MIDKIFEKAGKILLVLLPLAIIVTHIHWVYIKRHYEPYYTIGTLDERIHHGGHSGGTAFKYCMYQIDGKGYKGKCYSETCVRGKAGTRFYISVYKEDKSDLFLGSNDKLGIIYDNYSVPDDIESAPPQG